MIKKRFSALIERLIAQERSPKKLAVTVCLGIYIGISPLIGFHTIMTFLFGWMFTLNIAALFTVSFLIHNPWTTVPIYMLDHCVGKWLFKLLNIDSLQCDPTWVESCNMFLKTHTGISELSLSAFLIGGNLLAIVISVMLYPLAKKVFAYYLSKKIAVAS